MKTDREELRKLIEAYAESKVLEVMQQIKDDDNLENKEFEFDESDWLCKDDGMFLIISAEDIDEHEVECIYDAELNCSEYYHYKTFSLNISYANYCIDTFYEEVKEYNTYFDNADFVKFEKRHEYEEF